MSEKVLKILGIGTTVAGAIISVIGSWVGEQQTKNEIGKQVAEAVAEAMQQKES